jgi:hypothetical protein
VTASRKGGKQVRAHLEHNAPQHCSPTCSRPGCVMQNAASFVNYVLNSFCCPSCDIAIASSKSSSPQSTI